MDTMQLVLMWASVVLSTGLAVALPITTWRRLQRPETLREAWRYSSPGWRITGCIVLLVFLALSGFLTAVLAQRYPFTWATVALIAGGIVATTLYLVRFVSFDPREALFELEDSDESSDGGDQDQRTS